VCVCCVCGVVAVGVGVIGGQLDCSRSPDFMPLYALNVVMTMRLIVCICKSCHQNM
jgi:hypothetical protein